MSKLLLLIVFAFISKINFAQFKLNDTLFFVRDSNQFYYHKIFIDTNKTSEFYSLVSDFTFNKFDTDAYKSSLSYLYSRKLFPKKQYYKDFPLEWTMLETYKGKIYVYSPADYYTHYKIKLTDSVFINWTGEGPEATYINEFQKIDSCTYKFILTSQLYERRELTIKYLNKDKGIAIFHDKWYNKIIKEPIDDYYMMVDVKKMRATPLLVNTCDNQKQVEVDFDTVDYKKIFQNIK